MCPKPRGVGGRGDTARVVIIRSARPPSQSAGGPQTVGTAQGPFPLEGQFGILATWALYPSPWSAGPALPFRRKGLRIPLRVLLFKDVDKLGRAGDVKKVADGFGRNFLLPPGLAVLATPGALTPAGY